MPKKFLSLLSLSLVIVALCVATQHVQATAPQKERVDLLVSGGTVVTMDSGKRVIEDGAVAVRGDAIVAVGPRQEI
jgi:imidazolonepropionase-like amidohydrolase